MGSDKEVAAEALRLAALIKVRRKHRRKRLTAGALGAVCLLLVFGIAALPGRYSGAGPPLEAAAGSAPLMFPDAGGYVICGVICFTLGVAVTMLCLRGKGRKNDPARKHGPSDNLKNENAQKQGGIFK